MVGARRLWYPDGTMQHGGVILGAGGIAGHAHAGIRHADSTVILRVPISRRIFPP